MADAKPAPTATAPTTTSSPRASPGGGGAPSNPLTRKLNKILHGSDGLQRGTGGLSEEVLEALRGLSVFFNDNTKRARQNLRGDLERRSLAVNQDFIAAFTEVHEKLEDVQTEIRAISSSCDEMTQRLATARGETLDLIERTAVLRREKANVEVKATIMQAFLKKYQLTEAEKAALTTGKVVGTDFFDALERVKNIHENCKALLRTNQQKAGLSIMEEMATLQEAAFEHLYRWTQTTCKSLGNDSAEHPNALGRAMNALRSRPVLFEYSINEVGNTRRNAVVRHFIDALTRGGPGGTPRPIELHSHDPLRYTSDMLAWLHQCVASERELLTLLLSMPATGSSPASPSRGSPHKGRRDLVLSDADRQQMEKTLDHIMEGACRPFKVRLEQVLLQSDPGLVTCFRLGNLLQFYGITIADLIAPTAALPALLSELREQALKVFFDALNVHANNLLVTVEQPPPDLTPSEAVEGTLAMLKEILDNHDGGLSEPEIRKAELQKVLTCALDPLLQMCALSSSGLGAAEMATFMVNCLYRIQSLLTLYESTDERVEILEGQIEAHAATLVKEQQAFMLRRGGLSECIAAFAAWKATDPAARTSLSKTAKCTPQELVQALSSLDSYLAAADLSMFPQANALTSTRVRDAVRQRATRSFLGAYTELHDAVCDPANGYPEGNAVQKRPPKTLEALFM